MYFDCSSSSTSSSAPGLSTGEYTFTFWNSQNAKILDGRLTVDSVDGSGNISGSFRRTQLYDSTFSGALLVKGGNYSGKFDPKSGTVGFNLNPKLADNNVYISGKVAPDNIQGTWQHLYMNNSEKGKFSADLK